ncbi:hypothetical protein Hdeb2414_s0005g00154421 [Helianthus debilis subsp. tardiflorus]
MTEQTTRTTTRPRGSNQHEPTLLLFGSTKGRGRGDKMDIPCRPQGRRPISPSLSTPLRL